MPKTIIQLPTWRCDRCGFALDCEPTKENIDRVFNQNPAYALNNLKPGECPSCALGGKHEDGTPFAALRNKVLPKETDPAKKTTITIMAEEDVDTMVEIEGQLTTAQVADEMDVIENQNAAKEGRPAKHKARKPLTPEIKQAVKDKIRADIAKFTALQD